MYLVLVVGCDRTPYDLTVRVTDENDNAIPKAIVTLDEIQDTQATDKAGETTWTNLVDETVTLIVAAQGRQFRKVEVTLERGRNEEVIVLQRAVPVPEPTSP